MHCKYGLARKTSSEHTTRLMSPLKCCPDVETTPSRAEMQPPFKVWRGTIELVSSGLLCVGSSSAFVAHERKDWCIYQNAGQLPSVLQSSLTLTGSKHYLRKSLQQISVTGQLRTVTFRFKSMINEGDGNPLMPQALWAGVTSTKWWQRGV